MALVSPWQGPGISLLVSLLGSIMWWPSEALGSFRFSALCFPLARCLRHDYEELCRISTLEYDAREVCEGEALAGEEDRHGL